MSGKNIIFDDKSINKSNFYKSKNLFNKYDRKVDNILISKKESAKKAYSNAFLDIMMMMTLDLYL